MSVRKGVSLFLGISHVIYFPKVKNIYDYFVVVIDSLRIKMGVYHLNRA